MQEKQKPTILKWAEKVLGRDSGFTGTITDEIKAFVDEAAQEHLTKEKRKTEALSVLTRLQEKRTQDLSNGIKNCRDS